MTNPNTLSIHLSRAPSIVDMQLPPSVSSARKHQTSGILSRRFSPFAGITYPCVRSPLAPPVVLLCFCLLCIYCFFPLFFFGRPRDRCWCPCDRLRHRRHFFPFNGASRQAPPPLIIPISPIPFSHACIRFCYYYCFLLFWCIACFCNLLIVPYLLILNCLV